MSLRHKRGSGVRLDMTPMVDVAFLLLIFFMSTTTLRAQEEDLVELPVSKAGDELPPAGQIVITVEEDGSVLFSPGEGSARPLPLEELGDRVKEAAAENEEAEVLVFADGEVPYGTMTEILGHLQRSEIYRFSLVTDLEEE